MVGHYARRLVIVRALRNLSLAGRARGHHEWKGREFTPLFVACRLLVRRAAPLLTSGGGAGAKGRLLYEMNRFHRSCLFDVTWGKLCQHEL